MAPTPLTECPTTGMEIGPHVMTQATRWIAAHDPLTIAPWHDPVVTQLGYPPQSHHVETYWLPIIGPTALLILRRFALLNSVAYMSTVPIADLAAEIGLRPSTASQSPAVRSLSRLVDFHLARPMGDVLQVRTAVPPLTRRQVARLPEHLRDAHDREVAQR